MSTCEQLLKAATKRRGIIKGQITKFNNFLDNFRPDEDLIQLKLRIEKLELTWTQFDNLQTEIELLDESEEALDERTNFENSYYQSLARARTIVKSAEPEPVRANPINAIQHNGPGGAPIATVGIQNQFGMVDIINNIKVPTLELPQFSGGYDKWLGFRDSFESVVINNNRLADIQKLHYLRSCLKDQAARIILSLETSAENFHVAWDLLKERYDNKRIIIQNHMRLLFEIPTVGKEPQTELRALLDNVMRHLRALTALNQPTNQWDTPLVHLITTKLDKETRREWEKSHTGSEMPTFDQLSKFLRERCLILENIQPEVSYVSKNGSQNHSNPKNSGREQSHTGKVRSQSFIGTESKSLCPLCKAEHNIQGCDEFLKLSIRERNQAVKRAGLCYNCLRANHLVSECKSSDCRKCHRRHNTLLHPNETSTEKTEITAKPTTNLQTFVYSQVLLSTALVDIRDRRGRSHRCKIVLDNGSQSNFMTENLASQLNLDRKRVDIPVGCLNEVKTRAHHSVSATLKSRINDYETSLSFLVIPKIAEQLPSYQIDKSSLEIPRNIKLADPEFFKPSEVQALIGAEIFYKLMCVGQINLEKGTGLLQKTKLGWVVSGKINEGRKHQQMTTCCLARDTLERQIAEFWEIEEPIFQKHISKEEEACEKHFSESTQRQENGRYCVRLPFNEKRNQLGASYNAAHKRFLILERKLKKDPSLKTQYVNFMREYRDLGHMTEIDEANTTESGYYLPHHAVVKESSLTTKVRVVFDGSARTTTGISLNDTLLVGPNIQDNIFSLITRFRSHSVVLTADVEKMYRQVLVHPDDRIYQKILWRENECEPLKIYELNTVTYGTSSASFLAIRGLLQLAQDESNVFPVASKIVQRDFYVDDLLTGTTNVHGAIQLRDELIEITNRGGLHLRKWSSNKPEILEGISERSDEQNLRLETRATPKTLGVYWNTTDDTLGYTVETSPQEARVTKRDVLSQIAQLFDPLGLLGPIIIAAKIMMQQLWADKIDWDESVSLQFYTEWQNWRKQLTYLNTWSVPRQIIVTNAVRIELHGFADASQKAYGACIYIRNTLEDGTHECRLVAAKSRVAPLKTTSLPRLELCAALLLTKLYLSVNDSLKIEYDMIHFWSDSMITLHWIRTSPHSLNVFIANRVAEIQQSTRPEDWKHVSTNDNPADCISRGQTPTEFIKNRMWECGPPWLSQDYSLWPNNPLTKIEITERRPITVLSVSTEPHYFATFSSYNKLKRITAYCLRFANNASKNEKRGGHLTSKEISHAEVAILKTVQREHFHSEIHCLQRGEPLKKQSKISSLNAFIDTEGLARVGGRIQNSIAAYNVKHPILLPRKNHVTDLIIRHIHEENKHAGINGTLYSVRERFWPIDARNNVGRIVRGCVTCFRVKPPEMQYQMGNLPTLRVTASRPFENVGVDYCGPFLVKEKRLRNRNKVKVWIAIFVCFSVKAVHIDVVGDLTTQAFIACLRRFFARRGKARVIHSDNATNFVGANNELRELHELLNSKTHNELTQRFLADNGIEWRFSPPRTPHFGGLWESAVKSCKHHLLRTISDTLFTHEELYTYVTEIEAILNSRPLTPMSSDPNDFNPLTPGHFLIGDSLMTIPERDYTNTPINRLNSWQHIQKVKQRFWSRWYKEYLNEMNVRAKWHTNTAQPKIKPGTLVVLRDDQLPPMRWKLGRIIETQLGNDGVTRVVKVKTAAGDFVRGVKKISPLPIDDDYIEPTFIEQIVQGGENVEEITSALAREQYVLAPPFWRDCFGATVLARDVWARGRFGARTFWRCRFGAGMFWRGDVLARGRFGAGTFWRGDVLARGCFGAKSFQRQDVPASAQVG